MDLIDRFNDVMVANGVDPSNAVRISESIRREYCGGLIYVPKKSCAERARIVEDIKNNVPHEKIAKKYSISKITVYRMMRKLRDSRL